MKITQPMASSSNHNQMPSLLLTCLSERNIAKPLTFRAQDQNFTIVDSNQFVKDPQNPNKLTRAGYTSVDKTRTNLHSPEARTDFIKFKEGLMYPKESLLTKYKKEKVLLPNQTTSGSFLRGKQCNRAQKMKLQQTVRTAYAKMAELEITLKPRLVQKQVLLERSKSDRFFRE